MQVYAGVGLYTCAEDVAEECTSCNDAERATDLQRGSRLSPRE
jgi:hypothetical protein